MSKLIKDAIIQANEIANVSIEMAKEQFLESITPKIQSMLHTSMNEEADSDFEDALNENEQEELEEEFDISGFIQEDEAPEAEAEPEGEESFGDESGESDELSLDDAGSEEASVDGELSDETSISDLTVGELKSLFQDLIDGGGTGDDFSLDADADAEDGADLGSIDSADSADSFGSSEEEDENLSLGEILSEVEKTLNSNKEVNKLKKALKESNDALKTLTNKLIESNLLNSKLIYVNKLFKKYSLSESDKAKVIKSMDGATAPKEAKLVFEALDKTLAKPATKTKTAIKENLGFASTPAGTAPTKVQPIKDATYNRMQFLAGIIPNN